MDRELLEQRKQMLTELVHDKAYVPMKAKEIAMLLNIPKAMRGELQEVLDELVSEGKLGISKKGKYGKPETFAVVGTFTGHARGFGFVTVEGMEQDVFIPEDKTGSALNGDKVQIVIESEGRNGRRAEGTVLKVLEHANSQLVGYYQKNKNFGFVIPDDQKIAKDIFIPQGCDMGAVTGHKVVVKVTDFGDERKKPEGRIKEILGHVNDPGTDILSLVRAYNLPEVFPEEVMKERDEVGVNYSDEQLKMIVERRLRDEITRGIQTIQYQLITLMTCNGQAPFVTVFMYLDEVPEGQTRDDLALVIEEVLKQRIQGVKNEKGVWITPAFPKLIYVLDDDNITEDSKYWYLTEIAAQCTAKRMVPDYISEKKMKELKVDANGNGQCFPCMGCRSFLTPYIDPETGKPKYYGRFNQGVVTLNLVDVACSSGKDMDKFWSILNERLDLCKRALMCRHYRLKGTPSDVAPILWQNGALARLKKGETIDKLLYGGYSTISLGYAGLCECTYYMKGVTHTNPEGTEFALKVMQYLNDTCKRWAAETNIDFSLYGTPLESTTYKFSKCLQKRFGKIAGVTDKNYITNSYHVHVTEQINAFEKLKFESQFQKLSPGGAISYVEVPDMQNNIPAVLKVMQYIYENIMYAELNTKSDYCQECGYTGQIQIITDDDGKLIWECPNCGNRNQDKMNVARRTCGYIGTQFWNQGRTQEIKERVLHL